MLVCLVSRLDSNFPCLFIFFISFIVDTVPLIFLFFCAIPIRRNLTYVARALALDVSFLWIQVMCIDVVRDVVIWTINWLHYLNYEAIPRSSTTCN